MHLKLIAQVLTISFELNRLGIKTLSPPIERKNRKIAEGPEFKLSSEDWKRYRTMHEENEFERSGSNGQNDSYKRIVLPPPMPKRYAQSSRRSRYRNTSNGNPTPGELFFFNFN